MANELVGTIRCFILRSLLRVHLVALFGLLIIGAFAGIFPFVVCDNGDFLGCFKVGLLFWGVISGSALATVGLAALALLRPCTLSRAFLVFYAAVLVAFRIWAFQSASDWRLCLNLIAVLGVWTFICVLAFGAGKEPI